MVPTRFWSAHPLPPLRTRRQLFERCVALNGAGECVTDVKFCGMTRPEDAWIAAELSASFVGVIFAVSPRRLSIDQARAVLAPVRGRQISTVGVFDSADLDLIVETAETLHLDVVQLHGGADPRNVDALRRRFEGEVWAVVRIGLAGLPEGAAELFDAAHGVVLDTLSARGLGGTGESFDWWSVANSLKSLRETSRVVVAGGLRPDNVARVIDALAPNVVDVSSGVESAAGIKDPARLRAFMNAVRNHATR
jgi:phosphoribosylanthranilate isomerase